MKVFQAPDLEIVKFEAMDIITSSDELPFVPFAINEDELKIARID